MIGSAVRNNYTYTYRHMPSLKLVRSNACNSVISSGLSGFSLRRFSLFGRCLKGSTGTVMPGRTGVCFTAKSTLNRFNARETSFRISRKYSANNSIVSKLQRVPFNAYILLILPGITLYLGIWQIQRRKWKLGLIEELERKRNLPGVAVPHNLEELTNDREYETFIINGTYDNRRETYVGPRTLIGSSTTGGLLSSSDTIGVHVITPLKLADRDAEILVNRGWISMKQRKDNYLPCPNGEVQIRGVYRTSEKGSVGADPNRLYDARTGMWSKRDITVLAKYLGTTPLFFDAAPSSNQVATPGSPIPGQTTVQLRNEHLSYILTWFSLTALMIIFWCKRYLKGQDRFIKDMLRQADQMKKASNRKP